MIPKLSRFFVISVFLALLFSSGWLPGPCLAEGPVGTIIQIQGTVSAVKADGSSRALAVKSAVELSDTVVTEKNSMARIRFIDNGEVILRPRTRFKVTAYHFEQNSPLKDSAAFNLLKGGVRSITGRISKRGNPGAYKIETFTSVAGVRGTVFDAVICESSSCAPAQDGVYFHVLEGSIAVTNDTGTLVVAAPQYVFVKSMDTAPQALPGAPGVNFGIPNVFLNSSPVRQNIYCVECLVR